MTKLQITNYKSQTNSKSKISNSKLFGIWCLMIVIYLLFGAWCLVIPAKAQTLSLGIYPPILEVMMRPGKVVTQVYKLYNDGETDLAFTSKIVPFEPADEQGTVKLLDPNSSLVPPDWFSFQNADLDLGQKFFLKSGEEQEIVLKIKLPTIAQEDDYYATLLFETIPSVFLSGQTATQAQAKIGTNILLTVSKDGKPLKKAEIEEFKLLNGYMIKWLNWQIIDSFDNPQFILRIKNTGKAFFKPMGTITTAGWFGQKFLLDLLPENVLVNSIRQIQCQFGEEFGPCQLSSGFLLGRYKTKVEFGLDQLSGDYMAEATFFALPLKLILGLIVSIAIIWLVKSKQWA